MVAVALFAHARGLTLDAGAAAWKRVPAGITRPYRDRATAVVTALDAAGI